MFGKKSRMSSMDKFVVNQGRAVGNLKGAGAPFHKKMALKTTEATPTGKKQGKFPYSPRKPSLGKAGPMKMTED